jgi:peptidoglycan/LPS O-acetylase OafA/YrhL
MDASAQREDVARSRFTASHASVLLDLTRGAAALLVMTSHWRNLFFIDFHEVMRGSRLLGGVCLVPYLLTGVGHQAVVIFFVLSGYFISGSVLRQLRRGEWRWSAYLCHRMVRLWTVLLPGLLLCACWDRAGLAMAGARPFYLGLGLGAGQMSLKVFLGNLFFLPPALVPTFGTDTALWSLANEFWYYMLFPLAAVALWRTSGWRTRCVCVGLFAAAAWLVRGGILWSAPIWLLGTVLATVPVPRMGRAVRWTALVLYLPVLFGAKTIVLPGYLGDYLLGVCTALLLWLMLSATGAADERSAFTRCSRGLSRFSYTLYVVHLPVLVLAAALLVGGPRWKIDPRHVALAAAVLLAVVLYAYGVAWLTEFRTDRVRCWIERGLGVERRPKPTPHEAVLSGQRPDTA